MLCHVSVEGLFVFSYIKVRALLCALNSIQNNTDLMPGGFVLEVDQLLS